MPPELKGLRKLIKDLISKSGSPITLSLVPITKCPGSTFFSKKHKLNFLFTATLNSVTEHPCDPSLFLRAEFISSQNSKNVEEKGGWAVLLQ